MARLGILAAAAALLFASAGPAQAQYYSPGYAPGYSPNYSPTFYWYGVPNGGLQRTLGSGTSYYPYYNYGGYRSTYYTPTYNSTWNNSWSGYHGGYSGWNSTWSGRRGWRR
jgi:hypothetical protein